MRLPVFLAALAVVLSAATAKAHEFWLSPEDYTVAPEDVMQVRLRIGSEMKGVALSYLPQDSARFEVIQGDTIRPVEGRMGDNPALAMDSQLDGLAMVVHETKDTELTYDDFAVFQDFVAHKDFRTALADHTARGLPTTGFSETYRRHAKSLIAVGSGAGADRAVGLKIEIVALANPYTDDLTAGMPLLVLLDGVPRANAQLELFQKLPDGTVTISLHRTDADGHLTVPVQPGIEYLADSVDLRALPNDDVDAGPVWHSDWASLTFRTPD
ncbi:MAG: DUF4198 domain-containing protein [Pseudotabrizicola sp.]|uniref:DUF4198 domain-containing protein n=1 Tax=Pseudotabrizicola sp. TaxID=2939647 RepID=UPI00271D20C6|nr:DUF4198 domain-containing protein [Pseudotabrizicola sp.]MDO8882918.1 DUF4198 domain-containing protein [Pseudotabrizicola sp.]MDP2079893.1 DUF4198 domain-containing protein [Pseudotabrizicola sp.]MDZ7573162.1 DUF4198 domain-containing protein [Pseudotabrizicola sp.]